MAVPVSAALLVAVPVLLAAAPESVGSFRILHPADGSVFAGAGLLHVVVEVSDRPAGVKASLNGVPLLPPLAAAAPNGRTILHWRAPLHQGLNALEVIREGGGPGELRRLFYFSPLAEEKRAPPDFAVRPFHAREGRDAGCGGCHDLTPKAADRLPPQPTDSTCYPCHRDLLTVKQVHGPASLWACTTCHSPDSVPNRYATPVPVRDLCYGCHEEQREYFFSRRFKHGPTATGMCTICHDPHGSGNPFWLKKPVWDLCTTCHTEKAAGRHVLSWGPSRSTHPTRGRPDPMRPDRELSCSSCHNPHASASPRMWNFDARRMTDLCLTCHRFGS